MAELSSSSVMDGLVIRTALRLALALSALISRKIAKSFVVFPAFCQKAESRVGRKGPRDYGTTDHKGNAETLKG